LTSAMKHSGTSSRTQGGTPTKRRPRSKTTKTKDGTLSRFKRVVDARFRKVEKTVKEEIASLRDELRTSELALSAARLRALNERQAHEGLARLRADLAQLEEMGIVDATGRRIQKELPAEVLEGSYDA